MHQPDTQQHQALWTVWKQSGHLHYRDYWVRFDNCGWVALSSKSSYVEDLIFIMPLELVQLKTRSNRFVSSGISARQAWRIQPSEKSFISPRDLLCPTSPKLFVQCPSSGNIRKSFSPCDPSWGLDAVRIFQTAIMKICHGSKRYSEMGLQHPFILVDTNHDNLANNLKSKYASWEKPWWTVLEQGFGNLVRGFMIELLSRRWPSNQWFMVNSSQTSPAWEKHRPWSKKLQIDE